MGLNGFIIKIIVLKYSYNINDIPKFIISFLINPYKSFTFLSF